MESGARSDATSNEVLSGREENGSQLFPADSNSVVSMGADKLGATREGPERMVGKDADDLFKAIEKHADSPTAQEQKVNLDSGEAAKDSGVVDIKSDSLQDSEAKTANSKRRSQSASLDISNNTRTGTVPEPFHFSTDGRVRRSSDGALQLNPEAAKKRLRSPSQTAPAPVEESKATPPLRKTMPKPFNLEGMKRHEKALEQLKADIAAKEAEENAPRSFRARPILKPDAPTTRVVAPPTKPAAFKLSVEDRAERRDKFKKKVEDREREEVIEREKMLYEMKEELDKEEKQVRRKTSFKAAPARITPDNKVFKPKLGQTPKTEPQAPTLGAQRRHSAGAQEGDNNIPDSSQKPASPAPGASPRSPRPPPNRNTKSPSTVSTKVSSPRVSKPSPPVAAKTPVQTTSPKPGRVASPVSKPAPSAVKGVSPRLYKPVAPKSPSPGPGKAPVTGAGKTPSPLQKKPPGTSSPASPRPPSARAQALVKRRSSEGSGVSGKPSGVATGTPSPSRAGRSPAVSTPKQTPRPASAKVPGTKSPGGASPRVGARPGSASARPGEKKPTPVKGVPAKGPGNSPKVEETKMDLVPNSDSGPTEGTVVENGGVGNEGPGHVGGNDVTAIIGEPPSEPMAESELSSKENGGTGEEERIPEEGQTTTAVAPGKAHDDMTEIGDEPKVGQVTKEAKHGNVNGGTDEALLDTVLVQFDKVLTTES